MNVLSDLLSPLQHAQMGRVRLFIEGQHRAEQGLDRPASGTNQSGAARAQADVSTASGDRDK
jgi:hypothetical protein